MIKKMMKIEWQINKTYESNIVSSSNRNGNRMGSQPNYGRDISLLNVREISLLSLLWENHFNGLKMYKNSFHNQT